MDKNARNYVRIDYFAFVTGLEMVFIPTKILGKLLILLDIKLFMAIVCACPSLT